MLGKIDIYEMICGYRDAPFFRHLCKCFAKIISLLLWVRGPESSQGTLGRCAFCNSVAASNTLKHTLANDLERTANPPSVCQFFGLAKLGGLRLKLEDFSDGRLGYVVAVLVDRVAHHAIVHRPHSVQAELAVEVDGSGDGLEDVTQRFGHLDVLGLFGVLVVDEEEVVHEGVVVLCLNLDKAIDDGLQTRREVLEVLVELELDGERGENSVVDES